jgi:hypothetical protein
VEGKAILIGGGQYRVEPRRLRCFACQARWSDVGEEPATACPECGAEDIRECWGPGERCGDGRGRRGAGGQGQGSGKGRGRTAGGGQSRGGGQGRGQDHHGGT